MKMFDLPLCVIVCVNLFLYAECSIPIEKLCANPSCREPISKAQGSVKYTPHSKHMLNFDRGQEITIISKSKNSKDYWEAIINGKIGYVPPSLIREIKVFYKVSDLISVPVNLQESISKEENNSTSRGEENNNTSSQIPAKNKITGIESQPPLVQTQSDLNIKPDGTGDTPSQAFNVIEGTTIYEDITPSSTFDVKSTVQTATLDVRSTAQTATIEVPESERAAVPPEVIKFNENYRGQLDMKEKINIVFDKNDENVKIESKDLHADDDDDDDDEEEEDGEKEGEEEEEEEEEEDEEVEIHDGKDKALKNKENVKNETQTAEGQKIQNLDVEKRNADVVIVEKVTSQISANVEAEEVTVAQLQESVQSPPGLPSQWNLLNNLKATPPPGKANLKLQDSYKNNVMHQMPEANVPLQDPKKNNVMSQVPEANVPLQDPKKNNVMSQVPEANVPLQDPKKNNVMSQVPQESTIFADHSQKNTTAENMKTFDTATENPASTQFSSSPPQVIIQNFTLNQHISSEQTAPPEVAQNTIFNHFTASADTPPGNTYNLEPKIEKITREAAPVTHVTPEPMADTFSQTEALIHSTVVNDEKEASGNEKTADTPFTSPQPVITEPPILSQLSVSTGIPPIEQPAAEQPVLEINQKKEEMPVLDVFEVTDAPVLTEIPEAEMTEPKITEADLSLLAIEEKVDIKEETTTLPEVGEESGFISQITGVLSSWFTPTPKEQSPDEIFQDTQNFEKLDGTKNLLDDAKSGSCESGLGFDCKDLTGEQQSSSWGSWIPTEFGIDSIKTSNNTFLYLVVTAVTVLLFTLGHSFIEKRGKTGPLIAKINKLEQELLVASKECFMLKDEVQSAREKITLYENSANDELVLSLQAELEESKRVKVELEQNIEVLQQELDAATEAGLDLNKMLSEVLTQKGGSETLLKSVENLQSQLDRQQRVIDEMTKKLGAKNQENEALQSALEAANEKSENLEEQLNEIKHNLNLHLKEKENFTQDLNSQITQLKTRINQLGQAKEKEIAKLKKEYDEIQKKWKEATGTLTVKEEELKLLKEAVKKLKTKQDLKMEDVFDVCKVNGELAKEKKENQILAERLQKEEAEKKSLADSLKLLDAEVKKLKKDYEEAELKKDEAEKKLEVLSTYFKEKETQLQKELGLQEALWAQKKGDEKAVYNMMKSLQEEVESYKSQTETLKKEILDQERGLKSQMATLEQKAHENWVAARQAERKLEEAKQEMAQLRNRLTLAEKNTNIIEGKSACRSSEELNGVEAASPILHDTSSPLLFPPLPLDSGNSNLLPPGFMPPPMFMPPPIGGFVPPPPFLPGDRRPPPLGRMSSPPLNNRFSPSSPADYPYERMSSPPLSPSAGNYRSPNEDRDRYRHRSPPFPPPPLHSRNWDDNNDVPGFIPISSQTDPRRDHRGSNISSEHSSSESLDKSSRHSGRV